MSTNVAGMWLRELWAMAFEPKERLTVAEWSDQYRRLSPEASAEPGDWRTLRAPYQRGIMDALTDPDVEQIVMMTSAQVGKTEILNNLIGYHIDRDPCPILVIQPTLEMAQTWSKDRLAPMVRDTPSLHGKVRDPQARNSGNTILHKTFPGGHITMAGANSAASLASRPIRVVACDEVDRYPPSAGTEGDPIALAKKRSTTFWNRRTLLTSTPTIKGISRIEAAFEQSSQERYHVPCHACGELQPLKWSQVQWTDGDPETAVYVCEHCGEHWEESDKLSSLPLGEWRPDVEGARSRGFHLSEIYSPWVAITELVASFLEAKKLPETLKTWVNTALGETWEQEGETVEADEIYRTHREHYAAAVPDGVLVLTAGIDVQKDYIEIEVVGWSDTLESWSIDHRQIHGDPTKVTLWADLDEYLTREWQHEDGPSLHVAAVCIDAMGLYTDEVYRYCKRRGARRIYAIQGKGGPGLPLVVGSTRNNRRRARLFKIGVDTAKDRVYSRLNIAESGPGYCHFPADRPLEYFVGLASERAVTKMVRGRPSIVWLAEPNARNEPLDCRVYAMAALEILSPNWRAYERRIRPEAPKPVEPAPVIAPRRPRRGRNFVGGFST